MIDVKKINVPSKPRSKYRITSDVGGTTIINNGTSGSSGLPYRTDDNGNFIIDGNLLATGEMGAYMEDSSLFEGIYAPKNHVHEISQITNLEQRLLEAANTGGSVDLSNYLTISSASNTYLVKGNYALKTDIPVVYDWAKAANKPSYSYTEITGLLDELNDKYSSSISRTANTVLSAPNGSNGVATFRKLVVADLPNTIYHSGNSNKSDISWTAKTYFVSNEGLTAEPDNTRLGSFYYNNGEGWRYGSVGGYQFKCLDHSSSAATDTYMRTYRWDGFASWEKLWTSNNANKSDVDWMANTLSMQSALIPYNFVVNTDREGKKLLEHKLTDNGDTLLLSPFGNAEQKFLQLCSNGTFTWSGNKIWHAGNSNLSTINWTANNINATTCNIGNYSNNEGAVRLIATHGAANTLTSKTQYQWFNTIWETGLVRGAASDDAGKGFVIRRNGTDFINILPNGNFGINNTNPSEKLHVNGNVKVNGNIIATGEVTAYSSSDIRLKENIKPINNAIDIINKLNPVSFEWNDKAKELNTEKDDRTNYGLIAQEVEEVLPELIHPIYDDYKSVDYQQLIGVLIKAVQEQLKLIDELKKLINK